MTLKWHAAFWAVVYFMLVVIYGDTFDSYLYSIYFVTILYPVVIGTAYFFNFFLVPRFLMTGRKGKFILYFMYTLIVSAYLQIMMVFVAFIYLANYQVKAMHPSLLDVSNLSMTLYAIVFGQGFIILLSKIKNAESEIVELRSEQEKSRQGFFVVKSDRQNKKIQFDEILFVESLADYVKIHLTGTRSPVISKAKISHLEKELTEDFIRIHRSYIVNRTQISAFNSEQITVNEIPLPISRSYKAKTRMALTPD